MKMQIIVCLGVSMVGVLGARDETAVMAKRLRAAVKHSDIACVRALLDDGVDATAVNSKQQTVLCTTIRFSKEHACEIAQLLIAASPALVNQVDSEEYSPIDYAVMRYGDIQSLDLIDLLLGNGAAFGPAERYDTFFQQERAYFAGLTYEKVEKDPQNHATQEHFVMYKNKIFDLIDSFEKIIRNQRPKHTSSSKISHCPTTFISTELELANNQPTE